MGMAAYRCISGVSDSELPDAVARMLAHTRGEAVLLPTVEAGKGQYSSKLLEAVDWAMEVNEHDRPQSVGEWQTALAGVKTRRRTTKSTHKPTTRPAKADTLRTGMSRTSMVLTTIIVVLLAAGLWLAWQAYPEWFGRVTGDVLEVTEQAVPADIPGETPQETETGETDDLGEMVASTEDISPPDPAAALTESTEQEVQQPATEAAMAAPAEENEVTRLLAAAEADLKTRRLTSPVGNNAWEKYQQVLSLSLAHLEAMAGMERVIDSYMELFGAAVEQEDFDKASGYLARIRELHPDSPRLEEGEQSLEAAKQARADRLAEQERQRQEEEAAKQAGSGPFAHHQGHRGTLGGL